MIVVFFTSLAVGHETRRISARVSRRNCDVRWRNPVRGPASPRSRRAPRPSAPSPNLAARGDGVPMGFSTEVSRAGAGSGRAPMFSSSDSFIDTRTFYTNLAGVPGFEPGLWVLETDVLTVDTIPLLTLPIANFRFLIARREHSPRNRQSKMSFGFLMIDVFTAATTELFELETFSSGLLVLRSRVVATLTLCALQYDIITRHKFLSPILNLQI